MTLVFARKTTPGLTSLVKMIDQKIAASDGASEAFVVFLPADADADALKAELETLAEKEKLSVPLTTAADQADVTRKFKVTPSDDMPVNVLVYSGKKVSKSFTLAEITDDDVKAVQAAMEADAG